ncbi:MAG TPA: tetratricopeptide repeat-containing glycosyltransferase family protein [Azonexus sp.]|nr:tetratricopeptide repeat-containing glycosyltransferase family protein [Azonexus sp.]
MSIRDHLIRRLNVLTEKLEKGKAEQGASENWALQMQLGLIAKERGDLDTAAMRFRRVLAALPSYSQTHPWPEAHWHLAQILMAKGLYEEALPLMEELLTINANIPEGFGQLGHILHQLGRREEAAAAFERAFALSSNSSPMAAQSLAYAYLDLKDWRRASHYLDLAIQLNPSNVELRGNRAFLALRMGDYDKGWPHFAEVLSEIDDPTNPDSAQHLRRQLGIDKVWRGADLTDKHLLVWCEHGLGDCIMMARYIPGIRKYFGNCRITLLAPEALCRLFTASNLGEVLDIRSCPNGPDFNFHFHCSIMSLPHIFHSTGHREIPSTVPYLSIPKQASAQWLDKLANLTGTKVGLIWAGNPKNEKDALRSLPLTDYSPLFNVPGLAFISLQKGAPAAQVSEANLPVLDLMGDCNDMLDTGALIQCLDLVISVDTSVAHLVGALAKPIWLLNRHEGEWRWAIDREDSVWYPTMRIFNQDKPENWTSTIERIATALRVHSI